MQHCSFTQNMLTATDLQERVFCPIFEEGDGFMMLFELAPRPPMLESVYEDVPAFVPFTPDPSPEPVRRPRRRTRSRASWVNPTPPLTPPRRRSRRVTVPDLPLTWTFPEQILDAQSLSTLMDRTCRICLCEYEMNDEIVRLPCLHTYHKMCLEPWLRRNACCPQDQMRLEEYM